MGAGSFAGGRLSLAISTDTSVTLRQHLFLNPSPRKLLVGGTWGNHFWGGMKCCEARNGCSKAVSVIALCPRDSSFSSGRNNVFL